MNYKDKKKLRKIKSITTKLGGKLHGGFGYLFDLPMADWVHQNYDFSYLDELKRLIKDINLSKEELNQIVNEIRTNNWERRIVMNRKPAKVRKDNSIWTPPNKNMTEQSTKIRYPRKCRKTAWKRFYKLFPKLKPE